MKAMGLALAIVTLVIVAALAACGDDDDNGGAAENTADTPEAEYFQSYLAIHKDVNGRIKANSEAYPDAFEGDLQQTKASFPIYVALFDEFRERLSELNVPDAVQALHDDIVASDETIAAFNHEREDALADATSYAEVDAIFAADPDFTAAVARSTALCEDVEATASDHLDDFDLPCGE